MKHYIAILLLACIPNNIFAQFRLDAGARLGWSNAVQKERTFRGFRLDSEYSRDFSYGLDAKIGYEFKYGIGLYSGVSYDKIRYVSSRGVITSRDDNGYITTKQSGAYPHSSDFITIPVRLEYRFCHDIIRPYVGYGVSFQVHYASNYTDDLALDSPLYEFHRNYVIPTFMFGLDLEYKRFIFGFACRRDQSYFWREERCDWVWTATQNVFRLGYRLF